MKMPATAFTDLSTQIVAQVGTAITGALPVAGLVLSALIGYRIYKHFTR